MAVVAMAPQCLAASTLRLTLVIYDLARVGPKTLAAAEDTVSEIFAHANVQLIWRDGLAYAAERRAALNPAPEDPATLVITLQPESEAVRYGVRSVCGGIVISSRAPSFSYAVSTQLVSATSWHMNWGISCWARTLTRLSELHARDVATSRLGESCASVLSASLTARTNRSDSGSTNDSVAESSAGSIVIQSREV